MIAPALIECDRRAPALETLDALASALGCIVDRERWMAMAGPSRKTSQTRSSRRPNDGRRFAPCSTEVGRDSLIRR